MIKILFISCFDSNNLGVLKLSNRANVVFIPPNSKSNYVTFNPSTRFRTKWICGFIPNSPLFLFLFFGKFTLRNTGLIMSFVRIHFISFGMVWLIVVVFESKMKTASMYLQSTPLHICNVFARYRISFNFQFSQLRISVSIQAIQFG